MNIVLTFLDVGMILDTYYRVAIYHIKLQNPMQINKKFQISYRCSEMVFIKNDEYMLGNILNIFVY